MFLDNFYNGRTTQGVHFSRYIASWLNVGGKSFGSDFKQWLKSEGLTDQEIRDITDMATNGKMELEWDASEFLSKRSIS